MGPMFATLGFFLPELLALIIAIVMLSTASARGPARNYGLAGIGIMLVCSVLGLALSIFQNTMITSASSDGGSGLSEMYSVMLALRTLLNLFSLSGLLLVVWGLCKASRAPAASTDIGDAKTE